jgi:ribosomal protein L11 methyltransferase
MQPSGWLELSIVCDAEAAEAISERFGRLAPAGTSAEPIAVPVADPLPHAAVAPPDAGSGPVRVRAWIPDTPASRAAATALRDELSRFAALATSGLGLRAIGPLAVSEVADADWQTAWRSDFPVLRIGRIVVRPPWLRGEVGAGEVPVEIDPGQAFGTGLHPTTRLALQGLERWADEGRLTGATLLDVGTGSGILLIAALRLGAAHGLAVDVDPHAVAAATGNLARNGLADRATVVAGSLPHPRGGAPLVVANLIAALQVELAPQIAAAVAPGGRLLASGIFEERAAEVVDAFAARGLATVGRWSDGEWLALEMRHSA